MKSLKIFTQYKGLVLLVVLAAFLRVPLLGYSDFYGDETKAFYLRKDLNPIEFLLNQRKGPVQYIVTWGIETVTGGYDETLMRLPFALAGVLSVVVFYLVVKRLTKSKNVALISSYLLTVNGIFIAFSRTIQYHTLLHLFGLSSILFMQLYLDTKRRAYILLCSLALGISLLTHYDGIFFAIPTLLLLFGGFSDKKVKKDFLGLFIPVTALIIATFYIPYLIKGPFFSEFVPYITARATGSELLPHSSLVTFNLYNPTKVWWFLFGFSFIAIFLIKRALMRFLVIWFSVPFILFEIVFSNPGTHIQNYLFPIFILAALGIQQVLSLLKNKSIGRLFELLLLVAFLYIATVSFVIFSPLYNQKYPWYDVKILGKEFKAVNKKEHQLFIYGFPYNRGWREIRDFMLSDKPVEKPNNMATNDNDTVAVFYLRPIFKYNGRPHYYIKVPYNQDQKLLRKDLMDPETYIYETSIISSSGYNIEIFRRTR